MNKTIIFLMMIFLIGGCGRQTVQQDPADSELEPIDELLSEDELIEKWMLTREEESEEVDDDTLVKTGQGKQFILSDQFEWEETYDDQNRLISLRGYDEDGELSAILDRVYDPFGNLTNHYYYQSVDGVVYEVTETYQYDTDNRLIRETYDILEAGEAYEGAYVYEYDSSGQLIEKQYRNKIRKTTYEGTYRYEYDQIDNLIRFENYDSEDVFLWRYVYHYTGARKTGYERYNAEEELASSLLIGTDDDGNPTETYYFTSDLGGMERGTYFYVYDDFGRMTEITKSDPDSTVDYRYVYAYNQNGTLQSFSKYGEENVFIMKLVYEYDSMGNKTGVTHYNPDGEINSIYKFLYDGDGNLTNYTGTNLTYFRVE